MKKNETTIYPNNFKHNTTLLLISSRIRAKFLLFLQEKHKQTDVYKKRLLRSVFKLINCILTIYSFTPLSILNFLFSVTKIFFYSNSVTKQLIQVWHICSPSLPLPLYSLCLFCVLKQSPTCPSLIFSCIRYCSSFNSTALLTPIQLHLHTKKYVCVCKNEI